MTTTTNDAAAAGVRLPAEWEPQQAVLLAWPHQDTDWAYMLPEVTDCYVRLAHAVARFAKLIIVAPETDSVRALLADIPEERIAFLDILTNDTWTRDYGAITTLSTADGSPVYNDFCFNGWGLKFAANHDNLVTRKMVFSGLLAGRYRNELGFVLEGGSIESDGAGTILTTRECLLSPNRNGDLTRREIGRKLKSVFGAQRVLWLDHGALAGDDTDSHIDTLARLAPDNTIIYVGCDDPADEHFAELRAMRSDLRAMRSASGEPFNLVELPLPDAIYDDEGNRLPATYANFLIVNNGVLVPVYNQPKKDRLACQIIRVAFPGHEIVPVDCRALIQQHGSLHCATMQFPVINF
ncbi:MAG: agmatine deiminase family protein [Muribaculaceae bacterium]|nr:agmatine deiminase family protein [Muribaculaceae bacterium]